MITVLLALGAAAAAAAVTAGVVSHAGPRASLRRPNYRGLRLPTAMGIAVALGILAGVGFLALVRAAAGTGSERLTTIGGLGIAAAAAVLGYALLGLWDDLTSDEQGWRTHVRALVRGRATGGAVKLAGGAALALAIAAPASDGVLWALGNAAVIALSANLMNLLDARPGRTIKVFCVAALPILAVNALIAPLMAAGLGAALAFLRFDLRERAMLGDTGAYALGGLLGLGIVVAGSDLSRLIALVALVAVHLAADRPGLSVLIARAAPLRRADALGRVPE